MKSYARVVELYESQGFSPRFTAYVVFRGDVAGSATVNVSADLYHRLQQQKAEGETPEVEVELKFEEG